MRIARLDLLAFGPFTQTTLAFGERGCVDIVFGPNEAGKTAALRAVRQLLYGMPHKKADDFLHPHNNLRIGAMLVDERGAELKCIRRRGQKSLRGADDTSLLADDAISSLLRSLDGDAFDKMFGLSHEALVEGGEALAKGGGELGESLFAAGAGLVSLKKVQDALRSEAEELFKPNGRNQRIAQAISAYHETEKECSRIQLSGHKWSEHQRSLLKAQEESQRVETQLREVERERSRLDALEQALPLVARRTQQQAEAAKLAGTRLLRPEFAHERFEAVKQMHAQQELCGRAIADASSIDEQLAQIPATGPVLTAAAQLDELAQQLGSYHKAQRDLPKLHAERAVLQADAFAVLRQVRPDLSLDDVDQVRLADGQRVAINNLSTQHGALLATERAAREQLGELADKRAQIEARQSKLPAPQDASRLAGELRRAQSQGDLEAQRADLERRLANQAANNNAALERLPGFTGGIGELVALKLPALETIERFEQEAADSTREVKDAQRQLTDAEKALAEVSRAREELRLQGAVPSEADLLAARTKRQQGWSLVRESWLGTNPTAEEQQAFIEGVPPATDLAGAFERSVQGADDLADRLRREADRVARSATIESSCRTAEQNCREARQRLEARTQAHEALRQSWRALWEKVEIDPLTQREMRSWRQRVDALRASNDAKTELEADLQALKARIAQVRQGLAAELSALGRKMGAEQSLAQLVELAADTVQAIQATAREREKWESQAVEFEGQSARAGARAAQAAEELVDWQSRWAVAVRPLGLPPDATPEQAQTVLGQLQELFSKLALAGTLSIRIAQIGQEAQGFAASVRQLAERVDPECKDLEADQSAARLLAAFEQARTNKTQREALASQRAKHLNTRDQAERRLAEVQAQLAALCQEAGVNSPDDLPEAEARSQQLAQLQHELATIDQQLLHLGRGASVQAMLESVAGIELEQLSLSIAQLSGRREELQRKLQQLGQTIGEQQTVLAGMQGSDEAAAARANAQMLLAQVEEDSVEYVRLKLAAAVLREAMQRYRARNEGPVLIRASALFRRLTVGSFTSLEADYDEQGMAVLVGVRESGERVSLEGMSTGTQDQLYLALRLASIERFLEGRPPVPLLVDDILIQYDDPRAAATLDVLGELATQTQVIFFTHHDHLVQLARQTLGDRACVHELRPALERRAVAAR